MINTLKDLAVIILLICVILYIYMLIGMELYAYKLPHSIQIESNFDGLLNSFLSVFIIFANDGWSKLYFSFYQESEPISTSFYFLSLMAIGQYLMLNLLIAIIIENFEYLSVKNDLIDKINKMKVEEEVKNMSLSKRIERAVCCCKKKPLRVIPKAGENADDDDN